MFTFQTTLPSYLVPYADSPQTAQVIAERVSAYRARPAAIVAKGAYDIQSLLSGDFVSSEKAKQAARKVWGYIDEFMRTVARIGGAAAGIALARKIAKAAGLDSEKEKQEYEKAIAWATRYENQLRQMGYPSPESAAASALWQKGGVAPEPHETPEVVMKGESGVSKENLLFLALLVIALILLLRR
ncbi:MAG TPA: hypothetical protein ENF94_01605 [Candidatus Woesearchaeota archaeon]|nr:hypothetical protein [Candidatus Woesearchaeota archaeon]